MVFAQEASPALVAVATVLFVAALALTVARVVLIRRFRRKGPALPFVELGSAPKAGRDAATFDGLVQTAASVRGIRKGQLRVDAQHAVAVVQGSAVVIPRSSVTGVRFVRASLVPPVGILFDSDDGAFARLGFRADDEVVHGALDALRRAGWPVSDAPSGD